MTHLRKKMLEELQRRNYSEATTRAYLHAVEQFAVHFGKSPDKLGPDDLRSYQAYLLVERKLAVGSVVARVAALRFFFVRTLRRREFREELPYPKSHRRLPTVLSLEEVARLIDAAGNLQQRALLMTLYGTGMRRTEVSMLKVRDVDSRRMMIRVEPVAIYRSARPCWRPCVSIGGGRSRGSICSPAASDSVVRTGPYPTRPFGTPVKKLPPTRISPSM